MHPHHTHTRSRQRLLQLPRLHPLTHTPRIHRTTIFYATMYPLRNTDIHTINRLIVVSRFKGVLELLTYLRQLLRGLPVHLQLACIKLDFWRLIILIIRIELYLILTLTSSLLL